MQKRRLHGEEVFVIEDFLSAAECQQFIAQAESFGFESAPVSTTSGPVMMPEVRNNTRVMLDDKHLANEVYKRARQFLPEVLGDVWHIDGFNERWCYYRYDSGEHFAPHQDGAFMRSKKEVSQLTFMLYLNDGFTGGATKFYKPSFEVQPIQGQALVFVHRKLHEGAPILTGRKYVMRSDVMYKM